MSVLTRVSASVLIAALVTAVGLAVGAGAAGAQATDCSQGTGFSPAQVQIDSPTTNQTVSGTVTVKGTARISLVGQLTRVEVSLGNVTKAQTFEPGSVLNYEIKVDASSLPGGATNLTVSACGLLAWGEKSITVNVAAAPPTTRATTTTAGSAGPPVLGATSTSVNTPAGGPVPAGATTSTRVSTSTTTPTSTTEATVPPTVAATTTVARPTGRDTPLVLTETPPKGSSGPPVWVGAVVGISGGLGLLFSARPWRRRRGVPDAADAPLEEDAGELVG